jgi:hypothetical protein
MHAVRKQTMFSGRSPQDNHLQALSRLSSKQKLATNQELNHRKNHSHMRRVIATSSITNKSPQPLEKQPNKRE